jgi:sporulation protein YlmC with PRC-barrel domain
MRQLKGYAVKLETVEGNLEGTVVGTQEGKTVTIMPPKASSQQTVPSMPMSTVKDYIVIKDKDDNPEFVGKVYKPDEESHWLEKEIAGEDPYGWGGKTYQSYLTKSDIDTWISKDYGKAGSTVEEITSQDDLDYYVDQVKNLVKESEVSYQDRDYKTVRKIFKNDPMGAAGNAEEKALQN